MKIFLTGGTGGIGQAAQKLLVKQGHTVVAPSRQDFDITDFARIDQLDLKDYDVVINCAGANQGAYLGWHDNTWQNQANHVATNFTGPLLLAKQYTRQRDHGHFVYVTSTSVDDPISYTIFMVGSKGALRFSLNAVRRDYPNFVFTEIVPGKTRTNMLKQNYQGTKSELEIQHEYDRNPVLEASEVAQIIVISVQQRLECVRISPLKLTENK